VVANLSGCSILQVSKGRIPLIQILLQAGAKVNAKDATGSTPLHRYDTSRLGSCAYQASCCSIVFGVGRIAACTSPAGKTTLSTVLLLLEGKFAMALVKD